MSERMLAFVGSIEGEEWVIPIHGETRGKAKANFMKWEPTGMLDRSDFVFIRLTRLPAMDDLPFTPENLDSKTTFHYEGEDGEPISNANFTNDCRCTICKTILNSV